MRNIWTHHLKRINKETNENEPTFTQKLHFFIKNNNSSYYGIKSEVSLSKNTKVNFANDTFQNVEINSSAPLKQESTLEHGTKEFLMLLWTAKSHREHELGLETNNQDSVKLIETISGGLVLRYDVAGEEIFEIGVCSRNEAIRIIEDDNLITEKLYPDNPELKWSSQ